MNEPIVLVGHAQSSLVAMAAKSLKSGPEVLTAFKDSQAALWIATTVSAQAILVKDLRIVPKRDHRLLLLQPTEPGRHALLHAAFRMVVGGGEGVNLLPLDELSEVLSSPDREDHLIAVTADPEDKVLLLYRGNLEPLLVPFAWFKRSPNGPPPDFSVPEIMDFGQTVKLGQYEVAADAMLYEFDPAYRTRARARELNADESFGGALRRLRIQKGVGRDDFQGISAKEIGRIERGEITNPHKDTLAAITKILGVSVEEIATY